MTIISIFWFTGSLILSGVLFLILTKMYLLMVSDSVITRVPELPLLGLITSVGVILICVSALIHHFQTSKIV
jgi:hypothetical protein